LIDVVIPTLNRDSLAYCTYAARSVFGDTEIYLQSERGVQLGEIRNIGLRKCHSELVACIDDDVIVNKAWLEKCLAALGSDSKLVMVQGVVPEGETLGCMIVRREPFMRGGGFPDLDSYVNQRFLGSYIVIRDAVCYHCTRGFSLVGHAAKWIVSFYNTEFRAGLYHNPKESLTNLVKYVWTGKPEMVFCELMYMIKTFFALPFILEDKRRKF
jgi:glycosyltransferase involved in cell wall biosynthesis